MTDQPALPVGVTATARADDATDDPPRWRVSITVYQWDTDDYKMIASAAEAADSLDLANTVAYSRARDTIVNRARSQMEAADALLRALDGYRP